MLEGILVDLVPCGKAFEELAAAWSNTEMYFWASGGDRAFYSKAGTARWQERNREQRAERHFDEKILFGIRTKDGLPIGDIGINGMLPQHRVVTLGAKIGDSNYWGGGFGSDALLLIVDYCFHWLDMRKVHLATVSLNARVLRQMEKVGFVEEGRMRRVHLMDGVWADEVQFGILRENWPGREALIGPLKLREKAAAHYGA